MFSFLQANALFLKREILRSFVEARFFLQQEPLRIAKIVRGARGMFELRWLLDIKAKAPGASILSYRVAGLTFEILGQVRLGILSSNLQWCRFLSFVP